VGQLPAVADIWFKISAPPCHLRYNVCGKMGWWGRGLATCSQLPRL